jgi:flagellar biosynthesis component FlhA
MYTETKSVEKISQLSTSVFWLVIPSLSMFLILPYLLKLKLDFYLALLISFAVMIICYYAMIFILAKFGLKI